jgi:hypothetical protein
MLVKMQHRKTTNRIRENILLRAQTRIANSQIGLYKLIFTFKGKFVPEIGLFGYNRLFIQSPRSFACNMHM